MQDFFRVINVALIVYMLLIVLRIMASWFRGVAPGRRCEHPYQLSASGYRPLPPAVPALHLPACRRDGFHATLAGIFVLVVASEMTRQLANQQQVTAGYFLGVSVFAAWRMASIIVLVLLVACVARFVTLRFLGRTDTPMARMVHSLAQAPVRTVARYIGLGENGSEANYLLITIVILFGIWIVGRIVTEFLVRYLFSLS